MIKTLIAFILAILPNVALAQNEQPYAGQEQRPIKALSEQQLADLKAGRGMGLALAAELNGYPGPAHVLENADALGLSGDQRERTQALFDAMKAEAVPMGELLIEQETRLDRLFAGREITVASLRKTTEEIGVTQGLLRATHLKYHLAMTTLLSPAQVERYRELRGYAAQDIPSRPQPHRH